MRAIPTYETENGDIIQFRKFAADCNIPGFTHHVVINRRRVACLADGWRPSLKAAQFFAEKHINAAERAA